MNRAIRFRQTGGPEVLAREDFPVASPGHGEVLVRHTAIGVNFIDIYHRTGLYALPLPSGLGLEAAGVVEAIGNDVQELKPGDRVAYFAGPPGAYAERRCINARHLVPLPGDIDDRTAAAVLLKGMTVQMLVRRVHAVQPGETVLLHAAAGGVGLLACQWLKSLGATVIGTAGSDAKAEAARAHGCDHVIVYTREDFVQRVRELTGGHKVPVVYDSVGRDTFRGSLECLQPRGLLVVFGNGSGPVTGFDLNTLAEKGSLYVTRPTLNAYTLDRTETRAAVGEVFDMVRSGRLRVDINQEFPLARAAEAHRALESRRTTGSTILLP